jgi:beta-lactam-binding protein with PASTA domain
MRRVIDGLIVLTVLALIAAGIAWWSLRDDGPDETDRAGGQKQEDPVSLISSKGVEKNIAERLTARAGREVVVECPPKVNELVGTTFECDARIAGDSDVATVAKVEITGGGGQFEWTSTDADEPDDE